MKQKLINFLLSFNRKKNYSTEYKFFSIIMGIIFYLVILPIIIIWISILIGKYIPNINLPRIYELLFSIISIIFGLYFISWTAMSHWISGKGTPVFNAPSKKLIITGPYKLSRNPIQLGAIFYFLGLGMIYEGVMIGVITFIITTIGASMFHKFIEEEELIKKFGDEYIEYKETTPFLFPNIFKHIS